METETTGTMDPVEAEYFDWNPEGSPVSIHMHLGAMDGIARDVIEGLGTLPQRAHEVGGLLLGRVAAGERPAVWVERYQRIHCQHRFGPQFVLDSEDTEALEDAAASILEARELAVVGFYRSHTRPGFQLEESDFDLIRRYFSDPSDLILLLKAENVNDLSGQFHACEAGGVAQPLGSEFPFRGSVVTPDTTRTIIESMDEQDAKRPVEAPAVPREHPRRLVPDFVPSAVEPSPSLYGLTGDSAPDQRPDELPEEHGTGEKLKKWLPLVAALLLVGGVLWFLLQPGGHKFPNPAPAQTAETVRPLGLYVDAAGPAWRVLWNPNATALRDARSVQLFVREREDQNRDDQNRIDLSARDLASGGYQYRPVGNDVTFRLEVIDRAGQVSAESFRLMRAANTAPASSASSPSNAKPSPAPDGAVRITQPRATYRAPPVVSAGIRPRIKGTIPIDVRVHIDARGRVLSANPVTKRHTGLEEYLATRAVQAARLWRFDPARENGKAVPGTQIIHFVFEK